jgi:hypothetical protein
MPNWEEMKFFPVIWAFFPCYAEIFPVIFSHSGQPKTPMDAAFSDDIVVISGLIFGFSLYFSLLSENLPWRRVRIRLHRQPNYTID